MSFFVKQKLKFYKKFKVDIWGILKTTLEVKGSSFWYWKFTQKKGFVDSYCKSLSVFNFNLNKNIMFQHSFLAIYYYCKNNNIFFKKKKEIWVKAKSSEKSKVPLYNLFLEKVFKLQLTNKVYRVCDFFFFEYIK